MYLRAGYDICRFQVLKTTVLQKMLTMNAISKNNFLINGD